MQSCEGKAGGSPAKENCGKANGKRARSAGQATADAGTAAGPSKAAAVGPEAVAGSSKAAAEGMAVEGVENSPSVQPEKRARKA